MIPATSSAPVSMEPATNNPGLARYLINTLSGVTILLVFISFMTVHLYYARSALLDPAVLLILFFLLTFVFLSVTSLVMATRTGPGELPSRFSTARMDTFIQEELRQAVETAQAAAAAHAAASLPSPSSSANGKAGTFTTGGSSNTKGAAVRGTNWGDVDDADSHQLANVVSTAAMITRGSAAAEEAALELAAAEARLRGYDHNPDDATNSAEHLDGGGAEAEEGEDEAIVDGAPAQTELPPYMTEAMQLRRLRKLRRGLPLTTVSSVAQRILTAMEGIDLGRKHEELTLLLPGANWCRFCRFYQMNDTRHCDVCGRCVYRSNIHSSCCGTCIGYANSKYYVLFLWYLCVSFVTADVLDLYCVSAHYAYFFTASGRTNSVYYLVFVYSASLAIAGVGFLGHYLYAVGRGVGLLTDLLREQQEQLAEMRVDNNGTVYQALVSDHDAAVHPTGGAGDSTAAGAVDAHNPAARSASPLAAELPFSWRRVADAIGEGLPLPLWFWPTPTLPAVSETADPPGYWEALRDAIRLRLRSLADEDDVFGDEDDDVADHLDDGAPRTTLGAAPRSAAPTTVAARVHTGLAPATPPPPHAMMDDDTTVVMVRSAADVDARPPFAAVQQHVLPPMVAVSPTPPPAAMVAPARNGKAD